MSEPLVCCVCLTKDRPQMLQRAIACFEAQTYQRKRLLIVNSGDGLRITETADMWEPCFIGADALSVGALRNLGNKYASHHYTTSDDRPEIFVHWDDDDWSHPERIAEQVALLKAIGKECVGYREMLFWRTPQPIRDLDAIIGRGCDTGFTRPGEAWLYSNGNPRYALGTSLCYWRRVWEHRPFEDKAYGEDTAWLLGVDSLGAQSLVQGNLNYRPRMIASIHGGNTSPAYRGELMRASEKQNGEWKRAPQWGDYCKRIMEAHVGHAA